MSYIPSIDVHFGQFKSASDKLQDLSSQLRAASGEGIETYIMGLKKVWSEENTEIFAGKLCDIGNNLKVQADEMSKVVDDIEREAWLVFDAEMFSRGLAFSRCY